MGTITTDEMAERLLADRIQRAGSVAATLTDPIADTPMVVTLDELRPYNMNPRIVRNPMYEEIKASIHARGLDSPPPITRRPGEPHYVIRNGGNTRLSILGELWAETKDESFFRIKCLFRPWPERGDIVLLTGHLAENELHGGLTFIERALSVEQARELYEKELGRALTQTDLAKRLTVDGYPITQPHISRMQDAIRYLLPAIPNLLYAGLGKPQIERLTALRKAAARAWDQHVHGAAPPADFSTLFQDVLASFDSDERPFDFHRIQDELVGQMSTLLSSDYDSLVLEIVNGEAKQIALSREPRGTAISSATPPTSTVQSTKPPERRAESVQRESRSADIKTPNNPQQADTVEARSTQAQGVESDARPNIEAPLDDRLRAHIVTPADTTDRLQAIHRTLADATGEARSDFRQNVVQAIPVQAGGLHPISDVWYIEPALEVTDRLRTHIAQLAREVAEESNLSNCVESVDDGIGFFCIDDTGRPEQSSAATLSRALLILLSSLSGAYLQTHRSTITSVRLSDYLAPLLQGSLIGSGRASQPPARVSDSGLVKLFRMIRLARRLVELQSDAATKASDPDHA